MHVDAIPIRRRAKIPTIKVSSQPTHYDRAGRDGKPKPPRNRLFHSPKKSMKPNPFQQFACALLGATAISNAAPVLIPNGDFATAGGADFGFFESAPGVVSFPTTGGNGGGYALIDNTIGSWGGGLVSPPDNFYPGNQGIPLANLGLVDGETYTFSMDMKNFAGTGTGGLKLEAWNGGGGAASATTDMPASGSSTDWDTYTWEYTIPVGTTSIKVVPLLTGASGGSTADSVGFDNIYVDNTPIEPPPIVPVIPNGDFEIPAGANWSYFTDGFGLSYPTTGGNPGGNAVIDATLPGSYGVLVANSNAPQTLASLGLTAGETYTFQLDMKVLSGTNPGGIKVEFVPTASGDLRYDAGQIAALPNPVTDWNTYSFDVTIPPTCTQIQVVPLWGPGSIVAYDNVKILLPTPPGPLMASIAQGTAVSWTASSPINAYQPQESPDGTTWTNVGPQIIGNSVTSVFDEDGAAFYQVLESVPAIEEATFNGGFELEFFGDADGWESPPTQLAERITTDARTGTASMRIRAVNGTPFVAPPAESQTSQNTYNANLDGGGTGTITVGNTYTLSFWAKQISFGPSYVQQYRVSWLAEGGAEVVAGTWQDFSATVGGTWEEQTLSGLVAPEGATTAFIQIAGKLGGVDGAEGEVLIDDVSLISDGFGSPTPIAATPAPAVEVSWPSTDGQEYQVKSSIDLGFTGWSNLGGVITGDGGIKSVFEPISGPRKFYKVGELP